MARTVDLISATFLHRQELLRLVQFSALELCKDVDPMLRKQLGELVEAAGRYLEPWVSCGQIRCTSAGVVFHCHNSEPSFSPSAFLARRFWAGGDVQGIRGSCNI